MSELITQVWLKDNDGNKIAPNTQIDGVFTSDGSKYINVVNAALETKADKTVATSTANGLMSSADKDKLDGIAVGATANVGTITGVKVNGEVKGTSGIVDIGSIATSEAIANKADKATTLAGYGITDGVKTTDSRLTDARPASDVSAWAKAAQKPTYTASEVGALPSTTVIPDELADLSGDATHRVVTDVQITSWNAKANASDIPTEDTVSGWGFSKTTGTYSKPDGGIPKSDLASAVQTSLGKADTALQSFTETDPIFVASAAYGIKSSDITSWNGKYTKPSAGIPASDLANGVIPTKLPASDVTDTYSATGKVPVSGTAVASAISGFITFSDDISYEPLD